MTKWKMENAPKKWNLLKNQVKNAIIKFRNQMMILIADWKNQKKKALVSENRSLENTQGEARRGKE